MDRDRNNNSIHVKRPFKFVPGVKIDEGKYKEIYFLPTISYNSSDGGQIGMAFYNSTLPAKNLKWAISPAYGLSSKEVVGEGWISYDTYLQNDLFRKIQFKLNAKKYAYRKSETLNKTLSYLRMSPSLTMHFKHSATSGRTSKLSLNPIFLQEELFRFEGENVFIATRKSTLYRMDYDLHSSWKLAPSDVKIRLEYQPYKNEIDEDHHYLKLSASFQKTYKYSPCSAFDFRLWGSYFISNSQRESASFDPVFVKGSDALIYQGFNDYAYDDYYFNRANQGSKLSNQIGYTGGGFKTPLGSQYRIGQTNDFAFALNIKSDLPVKMPKLFPMKLFLDVGYYTTKMTSEQKLEGSSLYSGGVLFEYGEGILSIYLPLISSQEISDIYDTEGTGLLGRISFKMDLQRFNPWNRVDDYRF